jgi:hypothetical protein
MTIPRTQEVVLTLRFRTKILARLVITEKLSACGEIMSWLRFELKGDFNLILRLRSLPGRMMEVLRVKLDALTNKTAGDIVADKLSGQILRRRTGVLAKSVHAMPTTIEGTTAIRGGIEAAVQPTMEKFTNLVRRARGRSLTRRPALSHSCSTENELTRVACSIPQ